jgi:O-antigen/teichoic acid export membrane protein
VEGRALARLRHLRTDVIARDTVWATGLEGLSLSVTLVSFSLLGKQLGPEGFGAYASMYAIIGILGASVNAGVALSTVQHLVQDRQELSSVLRSSLGLVVTAGSVAAVVGTIVGDVTIHSVPVGSILTFMLAELLGTAAMDIMASAVYARDGVAVSARYRVVPLTAKLVVLVVLFTTDRLTITSLGIAYLIAYPTMALLMAVVVGRRYGVSVRPGRPHMASARNSALYSTAISASVMQSDGDKVVMTAANVGADTGLYAAAYRIVSLGMLPSRSLLAASHRRFLEHDETARGQHVRRALRFSLLGSGYGFAFAALVAVFAPLITVVLGDEFEGSVTMLRALALVAAVRPLADFALNGLLGLGRVRLRTGLTVCGALLALAMYVALVPRFTWRGAAIGTFVSEVALAVAAWIALVHHQRRHDVALPEQGREPAPGGADADLDLAHPVP